MMRSSGLLTFSSLVLLANTTSAQELLHTLGESAPGNAAFGRAVANAVDADVDGIDDVIVGAPSEETARSRATCSAEP
jgi:FG-GAP repeat